MAGILDEMAFRPPAGLLPEWWGGSGFLGMSPHEIAAMRQRQTAQPMMGRKEGAGTQFIEDVMLPKTPLDAALFAVGGVPGKVAKAATLAAGAALSSDDAEAGPLAAVRKGIKAYHGSPYDFDRFDLSKIGTGEGAQAYGHGLYFAESPKVAGAYKRINTGMDADGNPIWPPGIKHSQIYYPYDEARRAYEAAQENLARLDVPGTTPEQWAAAVAENQRAFKALDEARGKGHGRMYEVNINAKPEQFLDWDRPLREQPQAAKDLLAQKLESLKSRRDTALMPSYMKAFEEGTLSGEQVYRGAAPFGGGVDSASAAFRDAGIPGIKYLDQGSRTAGEGSRNYVVFDDKLVEILKKYGIALPGAGAVAQGMDQQ